MAIPLNTDLVSTCASLAERAASGAGEIDNILVARHGTGAESTKLQKLRLLSENFRQLGKDARLLRDRLRDAQVVAPELQTAISAQLPELDAAAAVLIKQLMRVGGSIPEETIDMAALVQYECFLDSTMRFLTFITQLLSSTSIVDQESKLEHEDSKLLLIRTASTCQDIARSGGILLPPEPSTGGIGSPLHTNQDTLGTMPPAYEELPAYIDRSASENPSVSNAESQSDNAKGQSSGGLLSAVANTFRAATAALRAKPEPLVVPLCHAAALGNVRQMRSLLDEGANINGHNEDGRTALICAILAGQLDAVRFLLEAGADHSTCDLGRRGKPPLFHAIEVENRGAAELLLKYGADVNQTDEWRQPYFMSLVTGRAAPSWIAFLLSYGADPCAKDMTGRPVVMQALQKRAKQADCEIVVDLLLRHGASPNSKDIDGTPLIHACVQQKREGLVQRLLAAGANPNATDISGTPLLVTAARRHDYNLMRPLLEHGADPNAPDIYGSYLILNVLCDSRCLPTDRDAMAEMLLEHGARGDRKDMWGVTALEHSIAPILRDSAPLPSSGAHLKIAEWILKKGGDPNQQLSKVSGEPTLLTCALDRGLWDVAAMVLRYGANPNLVDSQGRVPLLLAVQKGNREAVMLLIQHGATVNYPKQSMPLDVAVAHGNSDIIELLKAHGAISAAGLTGTSPEIKK
ncbi:hypothetical protein jhhlp_000775 [Lomentospora prolificans]|uniref:Uncharacterized protein n=1 Tax=Lomentospora prolificans TaxID=41688 RepID=A0A2N3NJE3_9PEZI|nr:hypothetical protein jhhlp_000775 [Lomentospora prolificans]